MLTNLAVALAVTAASALGPSVVIKEIVIGRGAVAQRGQIATLQFEVRDRNGKELANTWKRGLPYSFVIGEARAAPFWSFGLTNMKVGGVRVLEVKPGAAYGPAGVPPIVGPNSDLTVRLELVEVRPVK